MNGVAAVVVTYQPDPSGLQALLSALRNQVQWLIVIDNGSSVDVEGLAGHEAVFLALRENLGLAAAQNIGIAHALELGAQLIYLSDQDSLPPPGMVAVLQSEYERTAASGALPVAAVGPLTVDARTGKPHHFVVERWGGPCAYVPTADSNGTVEVAALIASGTLLSSNAIRSIGGMRSRYFIDHIDTEWCLRARRAGWRLLGVPSARLPHLEGDSVRRIWLLRWWRVLTHSPLRDYYMFRNTLLMVRDTPMNLHWRWRLLRRLAFFSGYFLLLGEQRLPRARLMWLGIWHGLRGRAGKLDAETGQLKQVAVTTLDPC